MNELDSVRQQLLWRRGVRTLGEAEADRLFQAYREPHRRYHTLSHIDAMLRDFDAQPRPWNHARAVEWAVWFHDAVYETGAEAYADNEAASARLLLRLLERPGNGPDEAWRDDLELARRLVLATRSHRATQEAFGPGELDDARRFLDLDLAILAAPWEQVLAFDAAIREEFSRVDDARFAQGRVQALRALGEGRIFQGPAMERAEQAARDNLERLAARWSRRQPPPGG
jgi:predicted metal-dependent HD superfamily phosphohydrolase